MTSATRRGQQRKLLFAILGKQTLRRERALALLQDGQQVAFSGALDGLGDELVGAALAVHRNGAAHAHQHAVRRQEAQQMVAILEHGNAQRCLAIDQVEVVVAGAGGAEPAHLCLDQYVEEAVFQKPAHAAGELADGERAPVAAGVSGVGRIAQRPVCTPVGRSLRP